MSTKNRSYKNRYESDLDDEENVVPEFKERRVQSRNWKKWYEEHEDDYEDIMDYPKVKK